MRKHWMATAAALALLTLGLGTTTRAQNAGRGGQQAAPSAPDDDQVDGWYRPVPKADPKAKPGPAPIHDISGTWEPAAGWRNGVQASGPINFPMDGRHADVPYTPAGQAAWKEHKYADGFGSYPLEEVNDPFQMCDPIGFPRVSLHDLRAVEILQTPEKTAVIYENDQVWRNIWTDGRDFPKSIPEPRWYGYSIGKWTDPTTFVVDTVGMDTRTWIDNVGRPHTKDLKVEETFHRVNHDLMELTLTIIDPEYYTKPWNALDKYPMRLLSGSFDVREMVCSESEAAEYSQNIRDAAAAPKK